MKNCTDDKAPELQPSEAQSETTTRPTARRVYHTGCLVTYPSADKLSRYPLHRIVEKGKRLFVVATEWDGRRRWSPVASRADARELILAIGSLR